MTQKSFFWYRLHIFHSWIPRNYKRTPVKKCLCLEFHSGLKVEKIMQINNVCVYAWLNDYLNAGKNQHFLKRKKNFIPQATSFEIFSKNVDFNLLRQTVPLLLHYLDWTFFEFYPTIYFLYNDSSLWYAIRHFFVYYFYKMYNGQFGLSFMNS